MFRRRIQLPKKSDIDQWFVAEVLPLERALMRFFRRHLDDETEMADLRQELYVRLYDAAARGAAPPRNIQAFAYTAARNLLIDRARRSKVISIDLAADLDREGFPVDPLTPERHASANAELRRFELGLKRLPDRCREVVTLRKVEGLSQRECAERMGISEDTVERQIRHGMRALADFMLGGEGRIVRGASGGQRSRQR